MRLHGLMFTEHFCGGLWLVTLGAYLGRLAEADGPGGFESSFVGVAYSTFAIGSMVSPFLAGLLADRRFSSERLLSLLHVCGGLTLLALSLTRSPSLFYAMIIAHCICIAPIMPLVNSLVMKNVESPAKSFPLIRLWGTIGWVCAGLLIGWLIPNAFFSGGSIEQTVWPMRLATGWHFVAAAYCLFLPHTPPSKEESRGHLAEDLRELAGKKPFRQLVIFALFVAMPAQFYYCYANLFFNEIGMERAAAKMTLGQCVEIGCMIVLPAMLGRFGIRGSLLLGLAAWAARYSALFLYCRTGLEPLLYVAIMLHGVSFTFVAVSLQIYLDRHAVGSLRATAQGVYSFCNQGIGRFTGANVAGFTHLWMMQSAGGTALTSWTWYWAVPACATIGLFTVAAVVFGSGRGARRRAAAESALPAEPPMPSGPAASADALADGAEPAEMGLVEDLERRD
ncbi:MAG: MFS transporter [Planctomycetota bacterium]